MTGGWCAPRETVYAEAPLHPPLPHFFFAGHDESGHEIFRTCCPLLTLQVLAAGADYVCGCDE